MSEESAAAEKSFQIYASGYPDDGMPLTESQLQDALSSGQLKSCDLIWCDNAWRQLSDVFELPDYSLPDYSDAGEVDIALKFTDLPACGIEPVLQHAAVVTTPWQKLFRRVFYVNGRMRPLWQLCASVVLLFVLVFGVYRYLLVPGINRLLWRPAYVLLINPYSEKCSVDFMGLQEEVAGNGTVTFPDIFGCMPRMETMYLKVPRENTPKKINVQLYAGKTVLVNPMGMCSFGVLQGDLSRHQISDQAVKTVLDDISSFQKPNGVLELGRQGQQAGMRILLDSTDSSSIYSSDSIVTESGLDFVQLGLKRSKEYFEHEDPPVAAAGRISRNLLKGIDIGGLKVFYRKGSKDVAECSLDVELPKGAGVLSPLTRHCKSVPGNFRDIEAITGKARCRIKFSAKQIQVTLEPERRNFVIKRNQRVIRGSWIYEAVLDVKSQQWTWRWRFDGQDDIKVARLAMNLESSGALSNVVYTESRGKK